MTSSATGSSSQTFESTHEFTTLLDSLFVYGSMAVGGVHYSRISNFVAERVSARIRGSIFRLESGYPVFVNEGDDWVEGDLVRLATPSSLLKVLDEWHACSPTLPNKSLFWRIKIETILPSSSTSCFVYTINPTRLPRSAIRIVGGDWKKDLTEKEPMTRQLTPLQRNYIQKLGKSTGRDIVPINLDLYRELMNKGLIVDKGRRLALTNLGHEVFRYLE